MNGFRVELLGRVLGFNGHATVVAGPEGLSDWPRLVARLASAPGVVQAMPYVEGQVLVSANGVTSGAIVRGVRPSDLDERGIFENNVLAGSLAELRRSGTAMIGSRMAQRMGLTLGSRISLISPKGAVTAFGTMPRIQSFRIAAIFEVGHST